MSTLTAGLVCQALLTKRVLAFLDTVHANKEKRKTAVPPAVVTLSHDAKETPVAR